MNRSTTPYKCHLLVCTTTRDGHRKSCGDGDNAVLKGALKDEIGRRGWKGLVRVSSSGCLGQCDSGPNVMIYPQGIWFSSVALADLPEILAAVEPFVQG